MSLGTDMVVTVVGVIYPAFYTYKSLKNKTNQMRLIWLRYWVAFSFYYTISNMADYVLFWVPFYEMFKLVALFWLVAAKASGANILYLYAIDPLIKANEKQIESLIRRQQKRFTELFWTFVSRCGIQSSAFIFTAFRSQLVSSIAFRNQDGVDGTNVVDFNSEDEEIEAQIMRPLELGQAGDNRSNDLEVLSAEDDTETQNASIQLESCNNNQEIVQSVKEEILLSPRSKRRTPKVKVSLQRKSKKKRASSEDTE
ncbi:Receptor expression-enhancing protein 3 [Halotydeus destructor]|nr:Receptor expression-enhancing protein 3 [Halotydeus destructor]